MERLKRCSLCRSDKSITEFNKNKHRKDGLQNVCRKCNRNRSRKYYSDNKEKHKKIVYQIKSSIISRNQIYVWEWLLKNPCVDCGETDIVALEFDHLKDKDKCISKSVANGFSIKRLRKEMDKCEVVCSNCHRKRTAKRGKWKILEYIDKMNYH
jgi:hypothetical protein